MKIRAGDQTLEPADLQWDATGLLPVVAQDAASGAVLMLAWANLTAVATTLSSGEAHFFSRSRQELWRKGQSSGNVLTVIEVLADCDRDSLLYRVLPAGPACHTGTRSCFEPNAATFELGWLYQVLAERRHAAPTESYTARLLASGRARIAQKVGEEAVETVIAALSDSDDSLIGEASDLLYHLWVLLLDRGITPSQLAERLVSRHHGGRR